MCEIRMTRVSVGHSWNAHGISGFDVELDAPGVDVAGIASNDKGLL